MSKLAIVTTHPIQYYAPLFAHLSRLIDVKVFYTWGERSVSKFDPGFNKNIEWDIPLLEGYKHEFLTNTSSSPGSHHFKGIINPQIIERLTSYNPEAILVIGWSYKSHLKVLTHFNGKIRVWFRGDSTLLDEKPGLKKIFRTIFLKWVYSHIDKGFYVGTNNKRYLQKFGLKPHQLIFSPHAIDNERFDKDYSNEAKSLRLKLGIQEREPLILFAGKFEQKKDPLLLLDAFISLKHPMSHLLFVGNGPLEDILKNRAAAHPKVHFLSFQNQREIPIVYHASDLFCLPSKGPGETWGLAVNEAMACGKAILTSDKVGCATDLVKEEENGSIFIAGSKEDLLKKLRGLLEPEKLVKFGIASKHIIQQWSYETISKNLLKEL